MKRSSATLLLIVSSVALAQPPAPRPPEPTLDELLGLTKPSDEQAQPKPAPDRSQADLSRKLDTKEPGDEFVQTVALMDDAAKRLGQGRDAGLETQRVQEEILKHLDDADSQKKGGKSRQSQADKSQQQPQPASQQRPEQRRSAQSQPGSEPGAPQVPGSEASLRQRAGNAATWGNLPARVRDALTEGLSDAFSTRYREKTEEYYRRLAEQRGSEGGR
jgi:hypothetical protein